MDVNCYYAEHVVVSSRWNLCCDRVVMWCTFAVIPAHGEYEPVVEQVIWQLLSFTRGYNRYIRSGGTGIVLSTS